MIAVEIESGEESMCGTWKPDRQLHDDDSGDDRDGGGAHDERIIDAVIKLHLLSKACSNGARV